ncbi:HlyD family efflux transporter periplasmic adaptor subunit [bacterium]|nr:MAG: HlyD family efflux transporter periplasmic adaptor subunit [bacterium]
MMKTLILNKLFHPLAVVLLLAGLTACSGLSLGANNAEPTQVPLVVESSGILAEGRVIPHQSAVLAFPAGGKLGDAQVEEGDAVEAGAVLVSLTSRETAEAALKGAELEVETARQQKENLEDDASLATAQAEQSVNDAQTRLSEAQKAYDDTHTRDFRDELDDKEEKFQQARDDLSDAQENLDKYQDLDIENTTRKSAQTRFDAAKEDYQQALFDRDSLVNRQHMAESGLALAQQALVKAQRMAEKVKDGLPDPDLLARAEKRLVAAEAQLEVTQSALANFDLTAPFAGTVMKWADGILPGTWVAAGQPVVYLADTSTWEIETTDLTELKVVDLEVGQAATLRLDAFPELELKGEIISIGRVFYEKSGDVQYTVRIRIDDPPAEIRWGMTAEVTFEK